MPSNKKNAILVAKIKLAFKKFLHTISHFNIQNQLIND